ncbi:hypothetical protein E1K64_15940 [Salmonella enterica subsp. enterica serovar Poona]|nr:hypothetical protein [Salmonella enterica subsp. enterica serovar Poona]
MNETYYYGQGKVYLAQRNASGRPGAYRWVGDVSKLELALSVENLTHKESYSGQRATTRRIVTGKDATVTGTWYEFSPENLATQLYGEHTVIAAGTVTAEALPDNIQAGDRLALAHQNVSDVVIGTLKEGTDYTVDALYGALTFLKAQTTAQSVNYSYSGGVNTTLFTRQPEELALRYEGINLAEGGKAVVVELYKIQFDPTSALSLISADNDVAGLETKAGVLFDSGLGSDPLLGNFGRIIHVADRSTTA